ncbi:hypothetical protein A2769_00045 [Candidatus Daviesbacteria bacterium RIFCSPHIGHO2_01_FULL_37_27]|nr:MAG: hypothetical protein A2769_00045 [Candidatus Daviesbacteria bacterium RIFCSPHIGHO2_01_FULL_37_27]OGE44729.1 MAG: hypothetical protein A3B39_01445 [Candidatus Daviesbacteria bacterium RIFCSPLOWO2_01_FULL_37_10]
MKILITGGAGFIGTNVAEYYLSKKHPVTLYDNFSRKGTIENAEFLSSNFRNIQIIKGDVRDFNKVKRYVSKNGIVFHLAGQVAVTKSINNPGEDFESNIIGTFNVLEAARLLKHKPVIIDSSTNKVYGELKGEKIIIGNRYVNEKFKNGISEDENLDFYSPYGCSKGAADQYVHDYGRIFNIPTVVFRQSCIYGPHQFGIEDQGWVAHFIIKALLDKKITIYGTGYQVRDLLFIDDLIDAYNKAILNIELVKGEIFNIGGGVNNTLSLLELLDKLENLLGKKISYEFAPKRPGDQDMYVSNIEKCKKFLNWKPKVGIESGLNRLITWVNDNLRLVNKIA